MAAALLATPGAQAQWSASTGARGLYPAADSGVHLVYLPEAAFLSARHEVAGPSGVVREADPQRAGYGTPADAAPLPNGDLLVASGPQVFGDAIQRDSATLFLVRDTAITRVARLPASLDDQQYFPLVSPTGAPGLSLVTQGGTG